MGEELPGAWLALQCIVKTLDIQCLSGLSCHVYKTEAWVDMMCKIFLCLGTSYTIGFSGTSCHLGHTLSYEMTILTLRKLRLAPRLQSQQVLGHVIGAGPWEALLSAPVAL